MIALLRLTDDDAEFWIEEKLDPFGDSFARDVSTEELRAVMADMPKPERPDALDAVAFLE